MMEMSLSAAESAQRPATIHQLYRLMTAHWDAGTLMAAVKLDLFTHMAGAPRTAGELAARCGAQIAWMEKLLAACVALGLIQRVDGGYQNSSLAQEFLVKTRPTYQGDLALHFNDLWERFGELGHTIQTGRRGPKEMSARNARSDQQTQLANQTWVRGMHNIAMSGQAVALAETMDLSGRTRLCDVGGGSGAYTIALCRRFPALQALILDMAEILPLAEEEIKKSGLGSRIRTRPCVLLRDAYGWDYDVVLLSGVLHGFGPSEAKVMLRKTFEALAPGGLILIQELLLRDDKSGPPFPALFGLNMTLGRSYTGAEIVGWLQETGFQDPEIRPIRGFTWLDSLMIAKKP